VHGNISLAMGIRDATLADASGIYDLLALHGWRHRIGGIEGFCRLLEASQRKVVAIESGRVVGFARGITDGIANGYLSMVLVAPEHRRNGVGSQLVSAAIGSNPNVTWVLRAGRGEASVEFFKALGFEQSALAMERLRADES
jgi:ribosomal protein S18 acetylase RimI-like enzyme